MTSRQSIPWRHRISTKILLPSVVVLTVFAAMVIIFTDVYAESLESRVLEKLREDSLLVDKILKEKEQKVALYSRFVTDMIRVSEQLSTSGTGRSVLVYLLDYLRQEGVRVQVHPKNVSAADPYRSLVRKGLLGVRATALVVDRRADLQLCIASGSPIERGGEIDEVLVASYPLNKKHLADLAEKIGVSITLLHDDRVVESSSVDVEWRQAVAELPALALRDQVFRREGPVIRDLEYGGDRQRTLFRPLEIDFKDQAVYGLSVSMKSILLAKNRIRRNTIVTACVVLVLVVCIYSIVIRRITRPITELAKVTQQVAVGDYDHDLKITTGDEVGELGRSYNLMIKRLEEGQRELEKLHQRDMERVDRLATIGELASGIAHEIRNPLAGISAAVQILIRTGSVEGRRSEILDEVLRQIDRLEKITKDLLDYSRPRAPRLQPTNFNEILDQTTFLVAVGEKESRVRIEKDYDPGLPLIHADPEQIQQVFLNVLINSAQAIKDAGVIVVKTRQTERDGSRGVRVDIADNGSGMSEETREKVVRPFFSTKHRGTGLGLAIVQQILKSHGATMDIESEIGKGTKISLHFPIPNE